MLLSFMHCSSLQKNNIVHLIDQMTDASVVAYVKCNSRETYLLKSNETGIFKLDHELSLEFNYIRRGFRS